jgi:hypothetical protein
VAVTRKHEEALGLAVVTRKPEVGLVGQAIGSWLIQNDSRTWMERKYINGVLGRDVRLQRGLGDK